LGTTGILAGGGGYFTDYVTNGRTLGALQQAMVMEFFFIKVQPEEIVLIPDIVFNTTTSATSVMSVKTNGELKYQVLYSHLLVDQEHR
jgi:hypothetical protein